MDIIRTRVYVRKATKLLSEPEQRAAEDDIASAPEKWPVVAGTGGVRKARAARGSSGKSGGVRVMYYFWVHESLIYLLDIYAKNEKENLSSADKRLLKTILQELKVGE